MRRDDLRLVDHLVDGLGDCRAANSQRTRAVASHAERDLVRITMDDLDAADIDAELVGNDLREGGVVALAVAVRPGEDIHRSGGIDANRGGFIEPDPCAKGACHCRRGDAAGLDIARQADTAVLAARRGFGPAGLEALVVDHLQRLVQRRLVIADVILQRHRRLVREGVLRNEIHPAELRRVHSDLSRRLVHHPFQKIGGFRTAGAAIGVDRGGGCRHALHVGVDGRDLVAARQQRGMQDRRRHHRES